jgi:hypothetical protein
VGEKRVIRVIRGEESGGCASDLLLRHALGALQTGERREGRAHIRVCVHTYPACATCRQRHRA